MKMNAAQGQNLGRGPTPLQNREPLIAGDSQQRVSAFLVFHRWNPE